MLKLLQYKLQRGFSYKYFWCPPIKELGLLLFSTHQVLAVGKSDAGSSILILVPSCCQGDFLPRFLCSILFRLSFSNKAS